MARRQSKLERQSQSASCLSRFISTAQRTNLILVDLRTYDHLPYNYDLIDYCGAKFDKNVINGKVVAEFTLKEITQHLYNYINFEYEECYNFTDKDVQNAGFKTDINGLLDFDRFIEDYGKGQTLYSWHIDDLKIYDEPKDIADFTSPDYFPYDKPRFYFPTPLRRPPQSWCYVDELDEV